MKDKELEMLLSAVGTTIAALIATHPNPELVRTLLESIRNETSASISDTAARALYEKAIGAFIEDASIAGRPAPWLYEPRTWQRSSYARQATVSLRRPRR